MRKQPERSHQWFVGLFMLGIAGLLTACASPGGEGCGGIEDQVSCVSVTSIQPTSTAGGDSGDVDVTFNTNCDGDPATVDPEPFTAHSARITFNNQAHPSATGSFDVTVERLRITYEVSNCPPAAVCPPLPAIDQGVSLDIPEDSTVTGTFPLIPLSTKDEFIALGGTAGAFPSYIANYTFTARTQFFGDTITVRGDTSVVLGSFNLCTAPE